MSNKVLIIDDSNTQLETLKLKFIKADFDVVTAHDASEGYNAIFKNAPDIILSDIMMPDINGYQFCRLLKNSDLTKKIPVILLTVLDKKINKFWGNKSGADKFIQKTTDFSEIQTSVNQLIEENPLTEEYKTDLLNSNISESSLQTQLNGVFDDLLMNSTFLSEFRELGEYISQEITLIEKTFELLNSFLDYDLAGFFINNPDSNEKHTLCFDINACNVSGFVTEKIKRDFFAKMPGFEDFNIRDFSHEILHEPVSADRSILNPNEFQASMILPFVFNGKLLGGICFYNTQATSYSEFKFYETMVNELFLLLRLRFLYSEAEVLSVTDGLTGLYNRRHFEDNLEREFLRIKRYHADLSLAMIDIDHFKNINDTYGHQCGDYVLKEVSKLIVSSFRKTDMIYRYGGEELVVILTETSLQNSVIPLERLREKVANHIFTFDNQAIRLTISIGIGCGSDETKTQKDLVEFTDKALYEAKHSGRNKVVAYSHE